jgi:hypothetical protein
MRTIIRLFWLVSIILGVSCKKSGYNGVVPTAALNVINAAPDVPALSVNFTSNPISFNQYQQLISFGSSWEWGVPPADSPILLISSLDTSKVFYSGTFSLKGGGVYSMYVLSGAPKGDVLFMEDSIPAYKDSTSGIRFINLSPDSGPITVNLQGNDPSQTEFQDLAYKQISTFKGYDATSQSGGIYNFEVWSKTSQTLLATFSWICRIQKSNTVVIFGSVDPSSPTPISTFQVNNF